MYFWTQETYVQVHVEVCEALTGPPMTERFSFSLPTGEAQEQKSTFGGVVFYMYMYMLN